LETTIEPVLHPVKRGPLVYFDLAMEEVNPRFTDVGSDEAVMLYTQYSTHWDGFPHKGSLFDADGDGRAEKVYYNGYQIVDEAGRGTQGGLGAINLSVAGMAETGVQGRGVLIDLRHHLGDERVEVDYATLDIDPRAPHRGPQLPLHEHCLFKLGIHLGELWYLTELATWLRQNRRSRFLLTAPPLRLPGAAGSPVTPVATV
jgi:hypothetical protein